MTVPRTDPGGPHSSLGTTAVTGPDATGTDAAAAAATGTGTGTVSAAAADAR
jgi:hypothetical protein